MEKLGENVKKLLLAGIGAAAVTAEKSKELLDEMVKKGELTVEQGKVLNEELKHNLKKTVQENVHKAEKQTSTEEVDDLLEKLSSYAGRKQRKRQMRQLWIARINAAARMNGLSYSKFMYGLKLAGVEMNRKILADMAINDAEGFAKLAELAKSKLA